MGTRCHLNVKRNGEKDRNGDGNPRRGFWLVYPHTYTHRPLSFSCSSSILQGLFHYSLPIHLRQSFSELETDLLGKAGS